MIDGGHDINLVVVDWRRGSNTVNYVTARRRVMIVGRYVAQFIESMVFHGGLNLSTTHLIGHSLGAHICGFGMLHSLYLFTRSLQKLIKNQTIPEFHIHHSICSWQEPSFRQIGPNNRTGSSRTTVQFRRSVNTCGYR